MSSESLARALQGGPLTYDSASLDRLTAMALGSVRSDQRTARESLLNSLGVSLIALKHARRFDLMRRAISELADCMEGRVRQGEERRSAVARMAVAEWLHDNCPRCFGSGVEYDGYGVQRVCGMCGGSRKKRYDDKERSEVTGLDAAKLARAFDTAHAIIGFAVGYAVKQAVERLR